MPLRDFKTHHTRDHAVWRFFLALCVTGILLVISTLSVRAAWDMYQTFNTAMIERSATESELATLHAAHVAMLATVKSFSSDRGLETAVRERFGMVRPGEGEIRIVRTKEEETPEAGEPSKFGQLFNALFTW